MSLANVQKQNFEEAKVNLQKAIQTNKLAGETPDIANYYQSLGILHKEIGRYDSAIYYYQVAAQKFELDDNKKALAATYGNIGSIHVQLKNNDEALMYYNKATTINKQVNNLTSLAHNYKNTGILFARSDKPALAKLYYDSAINITKSTGNKPVMMAVTFNYAHVLKDEGQFDKALESYFDVMAMAEELNYNIWMYNSNSAIGETYLNMGESRKAIYYLEEAIKYADEKEFTEGMTQTLLSITQAAIGINDREKATEALLIYKEAIDSLNFQNQQKIVSDLEARYQLKEKDTKLKYMERVNQSRTRLNYALAAVIVLAIFLFVFVLLSYRTNIKNLVLRNESIEKDNTLKQLTIEKNAMQTKLKEEEAEKLALSIKLKEEITGMIVHDLKNPLNEIINIRDDNPMNQNKKLRQSGKRMLTMVLNILDVYKYEFMKMPISPTENSLLNIAEKAIAEVEYSATEKNISIKNLIPSTIRVNTDHKVLTRVFVNLLTNAIKYSPVNGFVEINVNTEKSEDDFVNITVHDTGQGIPTEMHQLVFEKFSQVNDNNSHAQGSTGLGLTFCKMAIEAHGGKIGIDEKYTDGARVFFTLPLLSKTEEDIQAVTPMETQGVLTVDEKVVLSAYLPRLAHLEIYDISALRLIVKEIELEPDINKEWLADFNNAVNFGNEEQFKLMISQIKS
jgi:signal transduction histidine kinase